MYVSHRFISNSIISLILIISSQAHAESYVSGNQISTLIRGNTIQAKHLDYGIAYSVYFDKDGKTAYRKQGGGITQTSYEVKGDQYCIMWNREQQCARILDNGNGTYSRIDAKGNKIAQWVRLENGRKIKTRALHTEELSKSAKQCAKDTI